MTDDRMALIELIEKGADSDLPQLVAQEIQIVEEIPPRCQLLRALPEPRLPLEQQVEIALLWGKAIAPGIAVRDPQSVQPLDRLLRRFTLHRRRPERERRDRHLLYGSRVLLLHRSSCPGGIV